MNSITWQPIRITPAWRAPGLALLALIGLLLLAYRGTAMGMVDIWSRSETFAHAFVVPPIALWLIWRQRAVLGQLRPRPMPWVLLPMAVMAALWWLGNLVSVNAVTQLTFTAMLVLTVPAVLGWQVTRAILFPLGFLFFAVPIGEFMTPTLMLFTADFVVAALRLSGVPVFREGMHFIIPSGSWSVIDECSGIRYLMATVMVGSLFAYLNYSSYKRRFVFMVISFVVPILANWLRAYMIVMLAHLSGNKLATGVDHIVYGWVFFGIVIMALFFIGARWAEDDTAAPAAPDAWALTPGFSAQRLAWQAIVVAAATLAVTQLPLLLQRDRATTERVPVVTLPGDLSANWRADAQELTAWRPVFVGASSETNRTYAAPDGRVAVHLAYYRNQADNKKLVSSVNTLLPMRSPWNQLTTGKRPAALPTGAVAWQTAQLLATESAATAGRQRLTVWRLYWVGGHLTGSDVEAKLWQAWLQAKGEPDDAAAILLTAEATPEEAADRLLARFVDTNFDRLQRLLTEARASR